MPLYEYLCDACGQRFEIIQKFSDSAPDACRLCGKGPVHRQASSPAIQFKGSGWYITDYAKKSGADSSPAPKSGDAKSGDGKSDGKSGETKSDGGTKSDSGGKTESAAKSESSAPAATTSTTPATSKE